MYIHKRWIEESSTKAGYPRIRDADGGALIDIFWDGTYCNIGSAKGTGHHLMLMCNSTDEYPQIYLSASGWLTLQTENVANGVVDVYKDGAPAIHIIRFATSGSDSQLQVNETDHSLALIPNGAGLVKFGAYTAGAATDSTGYITISGALGNNRKLIAQA